MKGMLEVDSPSDCLLIPLLLSSFLFFFPNKARSRFHSISCRTFSFMTPTSGGSLNGAFWHQEDEVSLYDNLHPQRAWKIYQSGEATKGRAVLSSPSGEKWENSFVDGCLPEWGGCFRRNGICGQALMCEIYSSILGFCIFIVWSQCHCLDGSLLAPFIFAYSIEG